MVFYKEGSVKSFREQPTQMGSLLYKTITKLILVKMYGIFKMEMENFRMNRKSAKYRQ